MSAVAEVKRPETIPSPSPYEDGPGYLRAKGWKCLGFANSVLPCWQDPTKTLTGRSYKEKKLAPNAQGEMEPIQARTGVGENRAVVEQVVIDPPVTLMTLTEALQVQLARDQIEATREFPTPEQQRASAEKKK